MSLSEKGEEFVAKVVQQLLDIYANNMMNEGFNAGDGIALTSASHPNWPPHVCSEFEKYQDGSVHCRECAALRGVDLANTPHSFGHWIEAKSDRIDAFKDAITADNDRIAQELTECLFAHTEHEVAGSFQVGGDKSVPQNPPHEVVRLPRHQLGMALAIRPKGTYACSFC